MNFSEKRSHPCGSSACFLGHTRVAGAMEALQSEATRIPVGRARVSERMPCPAGVNATRPRATGIALEALEGCTDDAPVAHTGWSRNLLSR